jgi:hypothetical protein
VRLIISGIQFIPGIPRIILFSVYRKARGPFRFRQQPPRMLPQLIVIELVYGQVHEHPPPNKLPLGIINKDFILSKSWHRDKHWLDGSG